MDLTKSKFFLLATAFTTGACIMVLELTASRILAPSFGSGIYVWGSLIGVIMIALALGYYLGGRVADSSGDIGVLFKNLIVSALLVSIIPVFGSMVVSISVIGGLVYGPIISTIILFSIPMTLLAMVSPMVIKFCTTNLSELGLSAGKVYAISTVGSIAGTFLTAFFLIPTAGSRITLLSTALILFILGSLGAYRVKYLTAFVFLLPGLLYQPPAEDSLIYRTESEYNIISVLDYHDYRVLRLNYDYAIQSKSSKTEVLSGGGYWDYLNVGPLITKTDRILWLGMCAGVSPKQLSYFYNATIDAVEIDPKVAEVARDYFDLKESDEIKIHISDGREFLRTSGSYDIVNVDVFSGGLDVPFHMATEEFFQEAKDHMTEDGLLTMNAIAIGGDERVSNAIAYTMKQVFPSVFVVRIDQNRMLMAFKKHKTIEEIRGSLRSYDPKLSTIVNRTLSNIYEFDSSDGIILIDDKSNLDELSFEMVGRLYEI